MTIEATKKCNACDRELSLSQFNRCTSCSDGLQYKCKECSAALLRQSRQEHKETLGNEEQRAKWREARAKRADEAREATRESWRRKKQYYAQKTVEYRQQHPDRSAARRAVQMAIENGSLLRASTHQCANPDCGQQAKEYHHWSYEPQHRLSVIPLCQSCHRRLHRNLITLDNPQSYAIMQQNQGESTNLL